MTNVLNSCVDRELFVASEAVHWYELRGLIKVSCGSEIKARWCKPLPAAICLTGRSPRFIFFLPGFPQVSVTHTSMDVISLQSYQRECTWVVSNVRLRFGREGALGEPVCAVHGSVAWVSVQRTSLRWFARLSPAQEELFCTLTAVFR